MLTEDDDFEIGNVPAECVSVPRPQASPGAPTQTSCVRRTLVVTLLSGTWGLGPRNRAVATLRPWDLARPLSPFSSRVKVSGAPCG